ncbi:pyridoxamine 5'-phosphate oxidase-related FMN-binding protein [Mycobacteroides abscessus subsp. abscessus]|nr:pyridoxamine 5'-phosphate oxidase-related FMN-binding protein [Mycobacteroides abscessus subsp. abscessus]
MIPDWRTGSTLQLTGTARLNWDESTFAPGAQCSVDFTIDEVVETINGSPLRWRHAEPSPANPPL